MNTSTMTGTIIATPMAEISSHGFDIELACTASSVMPTDSVLAVTLVENTRGISSSFQAMTKLMTNMVASAGMQMGATMMKIASQRGQPSTVAASSSSLGIWSTKETRIHTVNGTIMLDTRMISPARLLSRWNLAKMS